MTQEKVHTVVQHFSEAARQIYGPALGGVILFGSCARGDCSPDSDIDLMVLLDTPQSQMGQERKKILDATDALDLEYDVVLTPVFLNKKLFEEYLPVSKFYQNVQREGLRYA